MTADDSSVRTPSVRCPLCGARNKATDPVAAAGGIFRCRICGSPLRLKRTTAPRSAPVSTPSPGLTAPLLPPPPRRVRVGQLTATRERRPVPPAVPVVPPLEPPTTAPPQRPPAPSPPPPPLRPPPTEQAEPDPVQAAIDRYALFEPEAQPAVAVPAPSRFRPTARQIRLAVAAIVVVAGVAAAVLWMRPTDSDDEATRSLPVDVQRDPVGSSTTTVAPAVTPAPWIPFSDPDGRFAVDLPSQPARDQDELPSPLGALAIDLFTSEAGGEIAVAGVLTMPEDAIVDLHSVAAAIATSSGLDITAEVPTVDGVGRAQIDVSLSRPDGMYMARFIDAGGARVYVVMAGSPTGSPDATYNRLVNSFKVL